jgi:phospholipid-binding lipoprotein MlaA
MSIARRMHTALALGVLVLAAGCATVPAGTAVVNPVDPWEAWNRKVFAFNDAIDEAVLKPVARTYRDVVPQLVRTGVSNFFGNIGDVWSTANHFLQGKVGSGLEMGMRVLSNTFFGLGGVLDPATELRLPRRSEDFGQTLGVWGLPAGPYIVLPLLGPSSLRDAAGVPLDRYAGTVTLYVDANAYVASALQLVNVRAELLATTQLLSDISLDRYSFVRDGYLSRRLDQVYDGSPPLEKFEDEGADPPPAKGSEAAPPKKGT